MLSSVPMRKGLAAGSPLHNEYSIWSGVIGILLYHAGAYAIGRLTGKLEHRAHSPAVFSHHPEIQPSGFGD
jgi:hypothetical protein